MGLGIEAIFIAGTVLAAAGAGMAFYPEWFDQINWKMRWMVADESGRMFVTRMLGALLFLAGMVAVVFGLIEHLVPV